MSRFSPFHGLVAATHSAFDDAGEVCLEAIPQQASHLLKSSVQTAFICGSTGESSSLTVAEREAITRRWGDVARESGIKVIAHVGHNSRADAIALAKAAHRAEIHGIAAIAPCYFKPATVLDLIEFFRPVAAAAPEMPFYFYDIPALTGVNLSPVEFLEKAGDAIPNLAGIKYTNSDFIQLQKCLQFAGGKYDILYGNDESLLCGWVLGTRGAVGSSYNFAARLSLRIIELFESGQLEEARVEQMKSVRLIELIASYRYLPAAKFVMGLLGVPVGPARSPLRDLSTEEKQQLERRLKNSEFWEILK